ncbi:MAG: leucine-rich repeat protein [Spirochaetaceae bacterium]|nr:leucine-rich repeat protein [Spirochaetaceae bacterium]
MRRNRFMSVVGGSLLVLALFLGSCRGLVEETGPDQEEAGAYLAFQLGEGGRTVFPSVETTGLTNFVLEGTREGGQRQDLGAWSSYSQFLSATVAVQPGVWRFTLTAQASSSRLAASLAEVVVNVGQNTLHFPLGYTDYGTAGGSGAVEVSLDIPSGGGVVAATGGLYAVMTDSPVENFQDEELQLSGATVHYQKAGVPVGQYFLKIKLYADAEKEVLVNTYEELVRVADGSRSVASREIESLNEVYSITYQWNGGGLASGATAPLKFTRHSSIALPTAFEVDKAGWCLLGWYDNAECSGVPITEIVPGTVQNKTLYAQWGQGVKVSSGTVASLDLTAVAGDYHIMVAGSINSSTIRTLKDKLTAAGETAKIHLDLSQTTGLTSIDSGAFRECIGLTSVEIPASVTSIGGSAFYGCIGLTSVEIPASVTSIGSDAFSECIGLTSVEIPAGVTSIGRRAFYDCSGLASVEIPAGVTSIGYEAFSGCSGLTSVEIPASVTSIGDGAFSRCIGLTSVYYQGDLARWCEGFVYNYHSLMAYCENLYINGDLVQGDLVIPAGVTSIGDYAFRGCSGLTSVEIPASVTSIGSSAFSGCSGLTSVEIPASVISIGESAFINLSGLTSVIFGEDSLLESIGGQAFSGCSGLSSVEIPACVTFIGYSAFMGCSGLTSVEIPASVTSIGFQAFRECSKLTSVTFEDTNGWYFSADFTKTEVTLTDSVANAELLRYADVNDTLYKK